MSPDVRHLMFENSFFISHPGAPNVVKSGHISSLGACLFIEVVSWFLFPSFSLPLNFL